MTHYKMITLIKELKNNNRVAKRKLSQPDNQDPPPHLEPDQNKNPQLEMTIKPEDSKNKPQTSILSLPKLIHP